MTDRELAGCALLPCPFCGGAPVRDRRGLSEVYAYADQVTYKCSGCGVERSAIGDTSKRGYADNSTVEQRAIAAWNRRTPSSEGDGRDGDRLDWLCAVDPARRVEGGMGFRAYEDVAPLDVEHSHWVALTDRFYGTAREAIDAAIAAAERGGAPDLP